MRGTVAKRLRRLVYGDRPTKASARGYEVERWPAKNGRHAGGRLLGDSLRREYQQRKRRLHALRRGTPKRAKKAQESARRAAA